MIRSGAAGLAVPDAWADGVSGRSVGGIGAGDTVPLTGVVVSFPLAVGVATTVGGTEGSAGVVATTVEMVGVAGTVAVVAGSPVAVAPTGAGVGPVRVPTGGGASLGCATVARAVPEVALPGVG